MGIISIRQTGVEGYNGTKEWYPNDVLGTNQTLRLGITDNPAEISLEYNHNHSYAVCKLYTILLESGLQSCYYFQPTWEKSHFSHDFRETPN